MGQLRRFWYSLHTVIRIFLQGFNFHETSHVQSFMQIRPSGNAEITLLFTDICKSYPNRECLMLQICLKTLFAKIFEFTVYKLSTFTHAQLSSGV